MNTGKQQLLDLALKCQAVRFGDFTLKSGRKSPYFFNAGQFNTGHALSVLGQCYAEMIENEQIPFDVLYGPAYKGIPLVSATAIAFSHHFGQAIPYAFNRKQTKAYGDGGDLVGAPLGGRVILIDDVITAGTTITETLALLKNYNATLQAVLLIFDRKEQISEPLQILQKKHHIPIYSVLNVDDLVGWLGTKNDVQSLQYQKEIIQYLEMYGQKRFA